MVGVGFDMGLCLGFMSSVAQSQRGGKHPGQHGDVCFGATWHTMAGGGSAVATWHGRDVVEAFRRRDGGPVAACCGANGVWMQHILDDEGSSRKLFEMATPAYLTSQITIMS